jgi:hypothetical protein
VPWTRFIAHEIFTLTEYLRDARVQDSLIKRIAGHEDGAVTFSIYGSRHPLKAMVETLRHIKTTQLTRPKHKRPRLREIRMTSDLGGTRFAT